MTDKEFEFTDIIFEALIGDDTDEYCEKYSSVYYWECCEFWKDLKSTCKVLHQCYWIESSYITSYIITNFYYICGYKNEINDIAKLTNISRNILRYILKEFTENKNEIE